MSDNGSCPSNIYPMVVHFQKKNVSKGKGGSYPNNICVTMVDQFINMCIH